MPHPGGQVQDGDPLFTVPLVMTLWVHTPQMSSGLVALEPQPLVPTPLIQIVAKAMMVQLPDAQAGEVQSTSGTMTARGSPGVMTQLEVLQ